MYKIVKETEYYTLSRDKPDIALVMIVKNEHKRLQVTLDSVKDTVKALIMYDTGSTDDTIDIIQNFSRENRINLYLIQGEFVNFSVSRNVVLEYAEKVNIPYLLLLDCNDELKGGEHLKTLAKEYLDKESNGFLLMQEWWSGQLDNYFNIRFIKNFAKWRYQGSVHEWLKDTSVETKEPRYPICRVPGVIKIYQDRTLDDDKSSRRFKRDRDLLLADYQKDPKNSRTVFYLAQTCECLRLFEDSIFYSKERLDLGDFDEEIFHSYMRIANGMLALSHDWNDVMKWYLKAYEFSTRIEPLLKIADYYRIQGSKMESDGKPAPLSVWRMAYMFAKEACDLPFPSECILFVDTGMYQYYKWHVLAHVAGHCGKYQEGKEAAIKAVETSPREDLKKINTEMLKFYTDKENEDKNDKSKSENKTEIKLENRIINTQSRPQTENKQQFIKRNVDELKIKFPKLSLKNLYKKAEMLWKVNN